MLILNIDKLQNVPSSSSKVKRKVDKLVIRKLETTPVDLSKVSNVVKNDVIKNIESEELVKKVNNINTTDSSELVKKSDYNRKVNES